MVSTDLKGPKVRYHVVERNTLQYVKVHKKTELLTQNFPPQMIVFFSV